MTTRIYRRHRPAADAGRKAIGEWVPVSTYNSRATAKTVASNIRGAQLTAYRPAGSFEAEVRADATGEHEVWTRYVGITPTSDLERENARLREVAATLADRWDEHASFLDCVNPDVASDNSRGQDYRKAAEDLRWILANGTIPRDLMTNEELGEDEPQGSAAPDGAS